MKLKFLKFVLPILLVLPSLALAQRITIWSSAIYHRTPKGTEITSPVNFYVKFNEPNDLCGRNSDFWGIILEYILNGNEYWVCGKKHLISEKESSENFNLPIGAKIVFVDVVQFNEGNDYDCDSWQNVCEASFEDCPSFEEIWTGGDWYSDKNYCFEIISPSGTIGNTQNWLTQNEILGYIGKLAEDIPNYIALMIGLPITFWFVEKTIAFVRGNFKS
jgi:hypothetical protein